MFGGGRTLPLAARSRLSLAYRPLFIHPRGTKALAGGPERASKKSLRQFHGGSCDYNWYPLGPMVRIDRRRRKFRAGKRSKFAKRTGRHD